MTHPTNAQSLSAFQTNTRAHLEEKIEKRRLLEAIAEGERAIEERQVCTLEEMKQEMKERYGF